MTPQEEKIAQLEKRLSKYESLDNGELPTYRFSSMTEAKLKELVDIEEDFIELKKFDEWFGYETSISSDDIDFLAHLIDYNHKIIKSYNEEDLKVKFISPVLNRVDFLFLKEKIRDFYEETLVYRADNFIFSGTPDFFVAKGISVPQKVYFFIQEFKKNEVTGYPKAQLLAELISAVELNHEESIRGAYIVGENWTFVILEKIGKDKYQYFVSRSFNCLNIEDLKSIYKNLLFVKSEIISSLASS